MDSKAKSDFENASNLWSFPSSALDGLAAVLKNENTILALKNFGKISKFNTATTVVVGVLSIGVNTFTDGVEGFLGAFLEQSASLAGSATGVPQSVPLLARPGYSLVEQQMRGSQKTRASHSCSSQESGLRGGRACER